MSEEKSVFERNVEMWEQMSGSYMDAMFKAMEKTMEQSAAFQKQLDQVVTTAVQTQMQAVEKAMEQSAALRKQVDEAVNTAVNTQMEVVLNTIQAVQRQIEALTSKVDQLLKEKA